MSRNSIRDIGQVLLILSPWNSPIPIQRAWCLFEISTALCQEDASLSIYLTNSEAKSMSTAVQDDCDCLIPALSVIQAEKAQAFSQEDRDRMLSVIRSTEGGFPSVSSNVKTSLRTWCVEQLRSLAKTSEENYEFLLVVAKTYRDFGYFDEAYKAHKASEPTYASLLHMVGTLLLDKSKL